MRRVSEHRKSEQPAALHSWGQTESWIQTHMARHLRGDDCNNAVTVLLNAPLRCRRESLTKFRIFGATTR